MIGLVWTWVTTVWRSLEKRTVPPRVDTLTVLLAAADRKWCREQGDPPSNPEYIQSLARTVVYLEDLNRW